MRWATLLFLAGCTPSLYSSGGLNGLNWVAPENDWSIAEPPGDLVGVGFGEGQTAPDFRLLDQHGNEVSLWQFYGSVILLDISTMWCAPCQDLALHTQETFEDYEADGFMYITALQEDAHGGPPTPGDLELWADQFGIEAPIVNDGEKGGTGSAILQGQFPAVLVIDRDMVVTERVNPIGDAEVRKAIEEAL